MSQEDKDILDEKIVRDIVEAVKSIKFGYVQVIVQDAKVVQIDRTEKIRLDREGGGRIT